MNAFVACTIFCSMPQHNFTYVLKVVEIKTHPACGQIISCSDITALAARDSVFLHLVFFKVHATHLRSDYRVPLGRCDGLTFATRNATLENLQLFGSAAWELIASVATKGLDATDLVAIFGDHTIGHGNCWSFTAHQDLYTDRTTRPIVTSFANNQSLFYERLAFSMITMSMLNVLTWTQGEIRANC
ncbi:hypothetical protein AQUCO_02300173v1 [Aquilegia coerulea]|uniref:Plant heme peroxidase family profile domain-containing protein n=1 Tax=Aquilegia coerulea TaxID=218851 RepID=A0A2G5DCE0_AQUCA|nr:hypothetical protein AQUCO_02300173v1 [Aquilegia coerulea]